METILSFGPWCTGLVLILVLYLDYRDRRARAAPGEQPSTPFIADTSGSSSAVLDGVQVETSWRLHLDDLPSKETRITALFLVRLDLGLSIRSLSRFERSVRRLVDAPAPTDPSWTHALRAESDDPARVVALLRGHLGERLAALSAHVAVEVSDVGISLSTKQCSHDAWNEWARREAVNIVLELEAKRRALWAAEGIDSSLSGYASLASSRGFTWTRVPLALWGRLHGIEVHGRAVRRGTKNYNMVMSARVPHDGSGGLSLRRRTRLPAFLDLRSTRGVRVEVPDAPFLEGFDARAQEPERAKAILSAELRSKLLDLTVWGQVELWDGTLSLRLSRVPDATELAGHFEALARLAWRLSAPPA